MTEQFNAFAKARAGCVAAIKAESDMLLSLDKLEALLPAFIGRRYHLSTYSTSVSLQPVDPDKTSPDMLHADVRKLYEFLLTKREDSGNSGLPSTEPIRSVNQYSGLITYRFEVSSLPGFRFLSIAFNGLPAGSACRIVKTVKGTRVVEDATYTLVCEDDEKGN